MCVRIIEQSIEALHINCTNGVTHVAITAIAIAFVVVAAAASSIESNKRS